jgi:hypothetical protein
MSGRGKTLGVVIGLVVGGSVVAGAAAFLVGIVAALSGDSVGGGVALAAAGLAFGLVANAVLRD